MKPRQLAMLQILVLALSMSLVESARATSPWDEWGSTEVDPYSGLPVTSSGPVSVRSARYPRAATATATSGGQAGFTQSGSAAQANIPWSGVWWPRQSCELSFLGFSQGLSPLEKYDSIVYSNWGQNPGAAAWEADPANQHNLATVATADWSGHCNGLAAAAILEPEPKTTITVPAGRYQAFLKLNIASPVSARSGLYYDRQSDYNYYRSNGQAVELTVADQKGWLCEMYMNVVTQQFQTSNILGTRSGSATVNMNDPSYRDIYPQYFHYLLQTYVKGRQQAIVADIDPGASVNNHPLYAYESKSIYYPSQRLHAVTTTVYFTDYARGYQDVGTTTMRQTYTYNLNCDAQGRVVSGDWTGNSAYNHPDFCWIPTAIASSSGGYSNAAFDPRYAKWIMGRQ
jgi:hypothetical protein